MQDGAPGWFSCCEIPRAFFLHTPPCWLFVAIADYFVQCEKKLINFHSFALDSPEWDSMRAEVGEGWGKVVPGWKRDNVSVPKGFAPAGKETSLLN